MWATATQLTGKTSINGDKTTGFIGMMGVIFR
jgi:hypothetical protein